MPELQTARQEATLTGTDPTDEATKRFEDLFRPPLDLFFKGGDFNDVSTEVVSQR
jgi:hypothetical protein